MKVFRDMFAAVLIGIMGGLLVTTISYYNNHKEGGVVQTLFAVADSFNTVARAYSDKSEESLLSEETSYNLEDKVMDVFEKIENGEAETVAQAVLGSVFSDGVFDGDVLAIDGVDGDIDEGEPYSGIMRFHVRANSDSGEDQELKMAVKEDVVTMLEPLLADCKNVAESKNIIVSNLQNIYTTAVNTITEQGYDYPVKVYVTEEEFPAKNYGDITFPAGKYQALRIDIGKAEGQNWWCVMYPPLCFMDESTMVVTGEGKEMLKENLTPKEYVELFANSKVTGESFLYKWILEKEKGK